MRMSMRVAVAAVAVALLWGAPRADAAKPCGDWTLYKQCGESWSGDELGTASGTSVCDAGCAMSSVAMALTTMGEHVDGKRATPGALNNWLRHHGGYVGGDELVWNAVSALGSMHMTKFEPHLTPEQIRTLVKHCHPVIANVRGGSHWVLVVGYSDHDDDKFLVNDPGFPDTSYTYGDMVGWVVYSKKPKAGEEDEHDDGDELDFLAQSKRDTASQWQGASLAVAAAWKRDESDVVVDKHGDDGVYGIDVSSEVDKHSLECMKREHDVSLVAARVYEEACEVDPSGAETLKHAAALGMKVDAYHFPCQSRDAKSQIEASIHHLRDHGVNVSTYWLDIEQSDWGSDHSRNVKFIKDLAHEAEKHGVRVGIYSSAWSWAPITGDTHELRDFPLWWPSYGSPPDRHLTDFSPFGGWSSPEQKQYKGNVDLCGANVDVSWRPHRRADSDEALVGAAETKVESCSFMKHLVDSTFSDHHDTWLCIAHAESSFEPHARNPSGATGLFQIMPMHCGSPGCPPAGSRCVRELEDPEKNARCARTVYHEQGFEAWTTYGGCRSGRNPC